jgi:hypothetical protein
MSVEDLLVSYGLSERLAPDEAEVVKMELLALQDAERFEEGWRRAESDDWRGD